MLLILNLVYLRALDTSSIAAEGYSKQPNGRILLYPVFTMCQEIPNISANYHKTLEGLSLSWSLQWCRKPCSWLIVHQISVLTEISLTTLLVFLVTFLLNLRLKHKGSGVSEEKYQLNTRQYFLPFSTWGQNPQITKVSTQMVLVSNSCVAVWSNQGDGNHTVGQTAEVQHREY